MTRDGRTLVFLIGPPAVGKMAVGRELSALTGYPLFHNHLSIEAVLPVFDFGTAPFNRLVTSLRVGVMREAGASDLPGLIFTYVWSFDHPDDQGYVDRLKEAYEDGGGRVVFAELWADLETRLARNETHERLVAKPSKRHVRRSRERLLQSEELHRTSSDGDFPFAQHLRLVNTHLSAADAARRIVEHFALPVLERPRSTGTAVPAIRVVVLCVFLDRGRILVGEAYDDEKHESFLRPLGGAVEVGESAEEALRREVREELRAEIRDPVRLGVLENRFTYRGRPGHEIVFVYDARLVDETLYDRPHLDVHEDVWGGSAHWIELDDPPELPLYPDGLAELLGRRLHR